MQNFPLRIRPSTIFCHFPKPAFIENIAGDDAGNLFVTSVDEGRVYKVDTTGKAIPYASIPGKLTGIIPIDTESFLCGGWAEDGSPTLYMLNKEATLLEKLAIPEAQFLNGMTLLSPGIFLICDAYAGVLWKYDLANNTIEEWLRHELLTRIDPQNPMPAANGIKLYNQTLFVSNTARNLLLRIPIKDAQPGDPEIYLNHVNLDDFAIAPDRTIYATTHIFNSVIAIHPDGQCSTIAGLEQGLAGSTAALLSRDYSTLYVTTNGGLSLPPEGGLQDGKIVKIELT